MFTLNGVIPVPSTIDAVKSTKVTDEDQVIVEEEVKIANPPIPSTVDASSEYSRPPGFKHMKRSSSHTSKCSTSFARHHKKNIRGISLIHELEKIIKVGNSLGLDKRLKRVWIKEMCFKHNVHFIGIQESKMSHLELYRLKSMWGNFNFDYACNLARGRSGGLISMWDTNMFVKEHIWCDESYIIVKGQWNNAVGDCFMINIYAPQESTAKFTLWNKLTDFMHHHNDKYILLGDWNVVRYENERFGSIFSRLEADQFNAFIDSSGFLDLHIGGRLFTWMNNADKLWSDHTPILLHVSKSDFGPTPFKFYNSWLLRDGFDGCIKAAWPSLELNIDGGRLASHDKLRALKHIIKQWHANMSSHDRSSKQTAMLDLNLIDKKTDEGSASQIDLDNHPSRLKEVFLNFFKVKFKAHVSQITFSPLLASNTLPDHDRTSLESPVSIAEIKDAVWAYGSSKAPGPDDFSFAFIKKYWDLLKSDIFDFVNSFFESGSMPHGTNSSFFTLIPKGDPLSPFLFILVMEGLYCAISTAVTSGLVRGIKISSSDIILSHLFYVDDVIITTDWSSNDLDNIIRVFHVFYLVSGLKINMHKSNICGVGVSNEDVSSMARASGCASGSFPLMYLGLPIGFNMSRINNWQPLIDRVRNAASLRDLIFDIGDVDLNMEEDTCMWSLSIDDSFLVGETHCLIDAKLLPSSNTLTIWDKVLPDSILLVKLKDIDSMRNMYTICRNEGFSDLNIHHVVDERILWIEISGLPLCARGSNAYKKIASSFGKFLFIEKEDSSALSSGREIGSWCIKIIDDYIDLSSNDNIKDVDTSSEPFDDHSVDDLEYIQTNLNNIVNQVSEQKMDNNEENKQGEEDIHLIVPQQPPKEEANNKELNLECKVESSDLSRPPGFEFMKKSSFPSSKCSTSFARFRKKDIKGVSLIHELNQIIDVGNSLGYGVRVWLGVVLVVSSLCGTLIFSQRSPFGVMILSLLSKEIEKRSGILLHGTKLSKLDRFLISEDVIDLISDIRITTLDRIWIRSTLIISDSLLNCHEKFRILKAKIQQWNNNNNKTMERNRKAAALEELSSNEKKIDEGSASPSNTGIALIFFMSSKS
ncbi:RNA-directed DNA polymerase, eukaryota, reverse transcriptase zinc-binding domain protein [Tanacetum coccineum]|uniref:RNA-directed DNA polymerase, eukaryota, reverse transcriptase zinc-binding domain protein n=1 Tax=Tanacetum coccineum TaxID=301880 RepID=A0ABQ5I6Q5_9ASTR